ncbi:type II secretion system F family protein [Pelagibacterium sp. H642]|uniref:type II secretion system F family protein n=1 Tax=Pelagibacterium sp. H642 TaxID=1881069 RepID=UPI0028157748|nr:type II secretion system F family protein [Pelagibacterium sp. H642]WMT92874.1 type II secretion system F family protein [Pelagibacterium sp. H642]
MVLSPLVLSAVVFVFTGISVAGLMAAAFYPRMGRRADFDRRLNAIAGLGRAEPAAGAKPSDGLRRQQSVEKTLRQMEEKQRSKRRKSSRPTLTLRLQQARLKWSRPSYAAVSFIFGLITFAVAVALGVGLVPSLGFSVAGGLLVPHLYVERVRKRRFQRFSSEFAGAMDIIVRGVKSGLPLVDCVKIVATEAPEPVRSEFKTLVDDQVLGIPVSEATQRLAERMPLTETNFFAIVIAIQSRTGGSLSEVLANLSAVLRDRKKMQAKIKAMSSEATASGTIIAGLPVVVASMLFFTSPDYIGLLFSTVTGQIVLAGCAFWMLIGVLVMRKMINFNF